LDRRTLFKRTLLGGALVTLGGSTVLALRRGIDVDETPEDLLALDAATFAVLVALAEVSLPCTRASAIEVAKRVDVALSYGPPRAQKDLKEGLLVIENALLGVFIRRQMTPFSALDTEGRATALAALRDSPSSTLRGAYHALRRLCAAAHYAGLQEAKETGYPGPPFAKPPAPAIEDRLALSPAFVVVKRDPPPPVDTPPPANTVPVAEDGAVR
jgi:hypothetical protein